MADTGVAFSGGGIRSAAFCSGVLRRLLQRGTKIDYLSCVSGGGYTGTAYLDWKYRHGKEDDKKWHQEFFEYMRTRAGLMCNWQKPMQGILDTAVLVSLVLFVSVVVPVVMWGSYMFPLVYAIDFLFRDLLIAEDPCANEEDYATPPPRNKTLPGNHPVAKRFRKPRCTIPPGTNAFKRVILFTLLGLLFIFFYMLAKKSTRYRGNLYFLSAVTGLLLAFTMIPYFINFFLDRTPIWAQLFIFLFSIVVWFFFPVLRRRSSLVLVVYVYAYIVYWKVYEASVFGVEYSDHLFYSLLFASGIVLWIVPALGALQQRLVHLFNRWRLQKAFYTAASVGSTGCTGIGCDDIFLVNACAGQQKHVPLADEDVGPLSLGHLEGINPQYISNVVVNEWRLMKEVIEPKYELLTLSPSEIERLDRHEQEDQFQHRLIPQNVDLSAAMATSAAAVAQHMGSYEKSGESFKQLQTVLGLNMGASMVSDVEALRREKCWLKFLPSVIEGIRVLPLVTFPLVYFFGGDEMWVAVGVFVFLLLLLMLIVLAVLNTGDENPGRLEKVARWFIVHVPVVRFIREMMSVTNQGPLPPPILRLSDGGHIENLAILPLLKRRLSKIIIADGGLKVHDSGWGDGLLKALSLAREKLNCSFIGLDGRDVIEDIKEKYVNKLPKSQPRSYRFKVIYYDKESRYSEGVKVGEGEVMILCPRHPEKGINKGERVTWKEALRDIDVDLEAADWGAGPQQDAEEVDTLTFCCCECCHGTFCQRLSNAICGAFPQHSTANQFFTPRMFAAYHREGYYACLENEAAEFLGAAQDTEMTATAHHSGL